MLFADYGIEQEEGTGEAGQAQIGEIGVGPRMSLSSATGLPGGSRYGAVDRGTTRLSPSATGIAVQARNPAEPAPRPGYVWVAASGGVPGHWRRARVVERAPVVVAPREVAPLRHIPARVMPPREIPPREIPPRVMPPRVAPTRVARPIIPTCPPGLVWNVARRRCMVKPPLVMAPRCPSGQRFDQVEQQCVPLSIPPLKVPARTQVEQSAPPVERQFKIMAVPAPPEIPGPQPTYTDRGVTCPVGFTYRAGRCVSSVTPGAPEPTPESAITTPTVTPQAPEAQVITPSTPSAAAKPPAPSFIRKGISPLLRTIPAAAPAPPIPIAPPEERFLDKKIVGPVTVKHALVGTAVSAALLAAVAILK